LMKRFNLNLLNKDFFKSNDLKKIFRNHIMGPNRNCGL
jgi:hypothetical protein